jgi:hypothetical protein
MFLGSRPKAELKRYSHIGLRRGSEQWDSPAFVLNVAGEAKTSSGEDVHIHTDIILAPALGKISRIKDAVSKFNADFLAGRKPIVRADLFALRSTSDPSAN